MSEVNIRNVTKIYPGHSSKDAPVLALDDISVDIADKEFCSIVGHSGCGKTTLLNMLAGFEQPTAGNIKVHGETVGRPSWSRAMVFQDYALFPWLTVEQNISFGLEMKQIPTEKRQSVIDKQIRLVGLAGFEKRYPHQLSGGMKQRVSIARALSVDPEVLLMDEPFAALDAQNRAIMQQEMGRLLAQADADVRKTMVLVTHSIEEAILLSDRIIVLSSRPGRIKEILMVDLPRPRNEDDPNFIALRHHLRELINEEMGAVE
ncbi:ABC transporter ATP-binding protein [Sulfuritalea sp.]|uniref:ABC transporter ATP-binding protein n=1 Tax=Sulfuritalea sp. TaxID=2480090 RepID=UPI00286E7D33|nr:ABC transporter ATP-binding protein [Sulfuritalea sp.]